jgi:predicted acetyltransferase
MSDIELVNPVPVEEARPWLASLATTLLGDPNDEDFDRRVARWSSDWIAARTWGVRASGRWVGTLATEPRLITVPGLGGGTGELAVDALTGVTVGVTHRRRGLLTRMITESLTAAKERGDAASILIAAEWPIYGRFGYAPATDDATYSYYSRHPSAAVTPSGTGAVRQVDPAELGEHACRIFATARAGRVGQVDRSELWWRRSLGLGGFERIGKMPNYYLREGADGPDGLLAWRTTQDFELDGSLGAAEVVELVAATDDAYRDLWALLSGLDVIGKIRLPDRPVDEQVRWLLPDGRALKRTYSGDHTWLRLLDVPAALSARRYAVPGRLVLDVVGDPMGFAGGRVRLEADGADAECAPSDADADLRLSHRALAAAYLGGRSLRELAIGGGVEELSYGALARADAMFGTGLAPWNATGF